MSQWKLANRKIQTNKALPALTQAITEQTLTASQALPQFSFRVKEGDFLWTASVAVSTGTFKTRIYSSWESRFFDNDFCRSNLFWGSLGAAGKAPHYHPPKFIPEDGELGIQITDTSGSGNTVALYLLGERAITCGKETCDPDCLCDRARWGEGRGLFVLNTGASGFTGASVAGSADFTDSLTPDNKWDMRVSAINSEATSDAWKAQFEYQDPRHDRRTKPMSGQLRSRAWTGVATAPAYPPSPYVLFGGSAITFHGKELSGSTNAIHLSMIGERISRDMAMRGA